MSACMFGRSFNILSPFTLLSKRLKWFIKAFKIWQKPKGFFQAMLTP